MMRGWGLKYWFSSEKWKGLVSPHIAKIVDSDSKYQVCREAMEAVAEQGLSSDEGKTKCNLLFAIFTSKDSVAHLRPTLSSLVTANKISSQSQLDQLLKWLVKEIKVNSAIGQGELLQKLSSHEEQLLQFQQFLKELEGEEINVNAVCKNLRDKFSTIDSKIIFEEVSKLAKERQGAPSPRKDNKFWDKIGEIKPRQLKIECNSKEQALLHKQITGDRLRFRFPPEPNGYLHIGHLKAMRINFESALQTGGTCYLRYDDTNPDKESHEFIQQIESNIRWLGYTPDKISFASDYFEELQHLAHKLVQDGHAYVCESTQEEIANERKNKLSNPYRGRSVEQNLKIFPNLTGSQTLRLKGEPDSVNPTLRDPVIYRQKSNPHPRTGSRFKIYPTYDFAHCTCDSLQHIDYSLCSLEFEVRRELYYTYLDLLGMWKPVVWEYSRLNVEGNVLSKRKIKTMIEEGAVEGWDDPRLLTIRGLINRGYTPQMLIAFIDKVNASRAGNEKYVQLSLLQKQMKKVLLNESPKTMGVLKPFAAIISNGELLPPLSGTIYLQAEDVGTLQKGETLILKTLGAFTVQEVSENLLGLEYQGAQDVSKLRKASENRLKILHWVAEEQSTVFPIVMFDRLLTPSHEYNTHSKQVYSQARVPSQLLEQRPRYVQLQRIGFFRFCDLGQSLQLCTKL